MLSKPAKGFFGLLLLLLFFNLPVTAQKKSCFTPEARSLAEQGAKVYQEPDPGYDPVLGFNPQTGTPRGAPPVDANGFAMPINCVADKKATEGTGTLPKFYCSVPGNVDENGEPVRYKVKPHFKGH